MANFILEIVIYCNNLTRLHVGWNTGGTVAESIIAGTLGNNTTAVSALLTLKNAGNRGAQGASGGSSLAKLEFNNGTAFEIDKYGRRTLPYQPDVIFQLLIQIVRVAVIIHKLDVLFFLLIQLVMVIILETITILPLIHLQPNFRKISSYFICKCHW